MVQVRAPVAGVTPCHADARDSGTCQGRLYGELTTMTIKPHVLASRPGRAARPLAAQMPLATSRVAFLGAAHATTDTGESIYVQSMCWAVVPSAWSTLTHAWQAVRAMRDEPKAYSALAAAPPSWVSACAPQLAAPFRDTSTAEESSVAALLMRTPTQIAITIVDARENRETDAAGTSQRPALADGLAIYDDFIRMPGRRACAMLVSRAQSAEIDRQYREELARCRTRMPQADWLRNLQLREWEEPVEPLPLELAHVVAASVVRHRLHENVHNPVFDVVLTKLAHTPFQLKRSTRLKRR